MAQSYGLGGFGSPTPSRGMAVRPQAQLPRPAFGSSPNLQALVLEAGERMESHTAREASSAEATFYEVTIASADQPKLLSRLSEALVRSHALATAARAPGTPAAPTGFPPSVCRMGCCACQSATT